MKYNQYKTRSNVWLYPGMTGWHFVSIPKEESEDIKRQFGDLKRGWGSLPVLVTIGKTSWKTSIFPDKKVGGYLLPIKADVRKKEAIVADDNVTMLIEIRV
ncbi:MAG: DUF1905 domain-containing protein [Candidatus Levybacteria bacterium]|nr:DUF1905 domain-containing protein [Candidatus Levybacteria bacterium]